MIYFSYRRSRAKYKQKLKQLHNIIIMLVLKWTFQIISGSDPTTQLMRFAKEIRGSTLHLDMISLGRGQGPRAEEIITKAYQQKGRWVFLQNCHHAGSFMPSLQHIVRKYVKIKQTWRLTGDSLDGKIRGGVVASVSFLAKHLDFRGCL